MKKIIHYAILLSCVILLILLYDRQLGFIPFLILSLYLFYFGYTQMRLLKKKK